MGGGGVFIMKCRRKMCTIYKNDICKLMSCDTNHRFSFPMIAKSFRDSFLCALFPFFSWAKVGDHFFHFFYTHSKLLTSTFSIFVYSITIFSFIIYNLTFTELPVEIFGNPHLPYFTNSEFDAFFSLMEKKREKWGEKIHWKQLTGVSAQSSHLCFSFSNILKTTDWCLSCTPVSSDGINRVRRRLVEFMVFNSVY